MKTTFNAVPRMLSEGQADDADIFVQVTDVRPVGAEAIRFVLRDQENAQKGAIWVNHPSKDIVKTCKTWD